MTEHTHYFWPVHFSWWTHGKDDTRLVFGRAKHAWDMPTFYQCKCGSQGYPL